MPDPFADSAYGTILARGEGDDDPGPETFTPIASVVNVTPPALEADPIDVTAHDSPNAWREFIPGLKSGGQVTFELNYVPDSATHATLFADLDGRIVSNWRVTYTDETPTVWGFAGFITALQPQAPVEGKASANVTIQVTGAVAENPA